MIQDMKEGGEAEPAAYKSYFFNDGSKVTGNYFKQLRTDGDGQVRINTALSLREDVYATAFAAMVRYQYVEALDREAEEGGEEEQK